MVLLSETPCIYIQLHKKDKGVGKYKAGPERTTLLTFFKTSSNVELDVEG